MRKATIGAIKKRFNRKGFSLTEMLCVVIVVVIMTAILTSTLQLASDSYSDSLMRSESRILTSTLTTVMTDELRYAGSVRVDDTGKIVSFFSQKYGELSGGFSVVNGRVLLGGKMLLSNDAYTYGQEASSVTVSYVPAKRLFNVSFTLISSSGEELSTEHFSVKPINAVKVS